jgi:FtsZ-binding cell division protein ZapB
MFVISLFYRNNVMRWLADRANLRRLRNNALEDPANQFHHQPNNWQKRM